MERKISISLYLSAFAISVVVFLLGIFVGTLLDRSSMENIADDLTAVSNRVGSVQLLMLMEGNSSSFCPVYRSELKSIDQEVETVGYRLSYLEDQKQIYDNELKRRYFILEAESYLLSKKINQVCGGDGILLVHFYSNKQCEKCKQQGADILEAREALTAKGISVKLFSFDGELDSPVVDAFKAQYNVKTYPSIVINDVLYSGYQDKTAIENAVRDAQ